MNDSSILGLVGAILGTLGIARYYYSKLDERIKKLEEKINK